MDFVVQIGNRHHKVTLPHRLVDGEVFALTLGGHRQRARWLRRSQTLVLISDQGVETPLRVRHFETKQFDGDSHVTVTGEYHRGRDMVSYFQAVVSPDIPGEAMRSHSKTRQGHVLRSEMTGKVLKVMVKEGDQVGPGDPVLVIEAMKMENRILAGAEGVITRLAVKEGAVVNTGQELVRIGASP